MDERVSKRRVQYEEKKEIGRVLVELGVNLVIIDEHKTLTYNGMFD